MRPAGSTATRAQRPRNVADSGCRADLSSLRRISYGGAPVSKELIHEALDRLGCDMQQRYGLTEAGGQVTILTPQDHRDLLAGQDAIQSSRGRETPWPRSGSSARMARSCPGDRPRPRAGGWRGGSSPGLLPGSGKAGSEAMNHRPFGKMILNLM